MALMSEQPQHLTALQLANRVRLRRAEVSQGIGAMPGGDGRNVLAELLELDPPPWWLASAPIGDVLQWPKNVGRVLMLKALRHLDEAPGGTVGWRPYENRPVRDLTLRQRTALAKAIRGHL